MTAHRSDCYSWWRHNGLGTTLAALFLLTMLGQWLTGWATFNEEHRDHHLPVLTAWAYLGSGHFWEATGENWESEFLQMGLFVFLTSMLYQKGSPESNDPDVPDQPPRSGDAHSPWPVRRGGWWLAIYRYSLSLAFFALFAVSFAMHLAGGLAKENDDRAAHGLPAASLCEHATSSAFWFESFQNWQSEFLSLVAMVMLSVWLRHEGSAESKPVAAANDEHGD